VRLSCFNLSLPGSQRSEEEERAGERRRPLVGRLVKPGVLRSSFSSIESEAHAAAGHARACKQERRCVFVRTRTAAQSLSPTRRLDQAAGRLHERAGQSHARKDDVRSQNQRSHLDGSRRARTSRPAAASREDEQALGQAMQGSQSREVSMRLEPFRSSEIIPHRLLERVSIQGCGLNTIPPCIVSLKLLTSLDLSWNGIRSLPSSIKMMKSLRWLDVSFNCLTHVPEDIGKLTQLQTLKLGDNFLYRLPASLDGHFFRLSQLHAQYNDLSRVPRQIFQIPSLTYLDLRGNSKLPGMIHQASTSTADVVRALREEEGDMSARSLSDANIVRKLIREMRPNLLGLFNRLSAEIDEDER